MRNGLVYRGNQLNFGVQKCFVRLELFSSMRFCARDNVRPVSNFQKFNLNHPSVHYQRRTKKTVNALFDIPHCINVFPPLGVPSLPSYFNFVFHIFSLLFCRVPVAEWHYLGKGKWSNITVKGCSFVLWNAIFLFLMSVVHQLADIISNHTNTRYGKPFLFFW